MSMIIFNKAIHKIERKRTSFAKSNSYKEFLETYKSKLPNFNNGSYWNAKFNLDSTLFEQDAMTIEKIKFIAKTINKRNPKILDLGIGQGYLEQFLSAIGASYQLYGIDISRIAIRRLNSKFKGKFVTDNIMNIDKHYKNNTFDIIVAIEVIEHISPHQIFRLYEKIHKLLKTNGIFIISTPLNEGLAKMRNNPSAHVREYTVPILEKEFEIAKFKIIKKKELYAFKSFYKLKKIFAFFIKRWSPNNIIIVSRKI